MHPDLVELRAHHPGQDPAPAVGGMDADHGHACRGQPATGHRERERVRVGGADHSLAGIGRQSPVDLHRALEECHVLGRDPESERDVHRVEPVPQAAAIRADLDLRTVRSRGG